LPESYRVEDNLIKGCQSKVWLKPELQDDKIIFFADSDSTLVKGLVSLLVRIFKEKTPQEILDTELYFMEKIGLPQMLSMNRSNGFASMIKQIKMYAFAYQTKLSQ
jgi:cysteine desulfuration protein SufE